MTNPFKTGDIVQVREGADTLQSLPRGKEFTIDCSFQKTSKGKYFVSLKENVGTYYASRFELVPQFPREIKFEDILPGDVIQVRVNALPGHKGLTHDPMTVNETISPSHPAMKQLLFSDSKSNLGHFEGRSVYTLISRPEKPKHEIADGTYWVTNTAAPSRFWWTVTVKDGTAVYRIKDTEEQAYGEYRNLLEIKKGFNLLQTFHTEMPDVAPKGLHALDKSKRYVIRHKTDPKQNYLVRHGDGGWELKRPRSDTYESIQWGAHENALYRGDLIEFLPPEEHPKTPQERLDEMGVVPMEIYQRETTGAFYRFLGNGKLQHTRFEGDGWTRQIDVDEFRVDEVAQGLLKLYV